MKAYVKVIYSSEGASPGEVEKAFTEIGFLRLKGSSVFEIDVREETELSEKLDKLHDALRGLEVRYMSSIQVPEEVPSTEVPSYRQRLEKWRAIGIDVDDLIETLERNIDDFRERAKEIWMAQIDRIADEREREMAELEAKKKLEDAREGILREVEMEGRSFHELVNTIDIDSEVLSDILDDLVEKGRIKAEQKGRHVIFVLA
jgi:predicted transcriptional regulator